MKKPTVRTIIATAFVVLFWGANAARAQTGCSKTTDADLVQTIKEKFAADADIKDQMRHLNVSVKRRTVTLEGWLDGKERVAKAVALAKKTSCAKRVISRLKENGTGSCGAGLRPCGDSCIDRRSVCNIDN